MDSFEYIELIERKKEVQELLLNFIDSIDDDKVEILKLSEIIENNKIELKEFLYLITNISENHHRYPSLFPKIEQILLIYKESIKQNFSNYEIFQIFKNNKKILLFLIKEKLFEIDQKICNILISYQYKNNKYLHYFFPEIKPFIDSKLVSQIEKEIHEFIQNGFEVFENNRKIGENDLYVCNLIRNDLVEDFIAYTTKSCMNLSSNINRKSIFETNSFLMERTPTLIEYATYFGSIQIFKYLAINNVQLKPSLWEYAVYSNNAEIIHLLEEHKVKCNDYGMCFNDSIKCHHNNIATYIKENYINYYINTNNGIMYYNYAFFPKYENICSFFASSCKYNHQTFVEVFLYSTEIIININNNKILFYVFLIIIFSFFFFKKTALQIAVENENVDLVYLLLTHPDIMINSYINYGIDPLFMAIEMNSVEIVKVLLSHPTTAINKINIFKFLFLNDIYNNLLDLLC